MSHLWSIAIDVRKTHVIWMHVPNEYPLATHIYIKCCCWIDAKRRPNEKQATENNANQNCSLYICAVNGLRESMQTNICNMTEINRIIFNYHLHTYTISIAFPQLTYFATMHAQHREKQHSSAKKWRMSTMATTLTPTIATTNATAGVELSHYSYAY